MKIIFFLFHICLLQFLDFVLYTRKKRIFRIDFPATLLYIHKTLFLFSPKSHSTPLSLLLLLAQYRFHLLFFFSSFQHKIYLLLYILQRLRFLFFHNFLLFFHCLVFIIFTTDFFKSRDKVSFFCGVFFFFFL